MNGPCVIRAPLWLPDKQGEFYMYFSDHRGVNIFVAVAERPSGPWAVLEQTALSIEQATPLFHHIASPDVWVDHRSQRVWLTVHGRVETRRQGTILRQSEDGLRFHPPEGAQGKLFSQVPYVRIFQLRGEVFLAEKFEEGLKFSKAGEISENFEPFWSLKGRKFRNIRHFCVAVLEKKLHIFFSRVGDRPESLLRVEIDVTDVRRQWAVASKVHRVRSPTEEWEGGTLPLQRSKKGMANGVNQLRDPYLYKDDVWSCLFYSFAGESGIAVSEWCPTKVRPRW